MVHMVEDMFSSNFLTDNIPQAYHSYIEILNNLLQRPYILMVIVDFDGEKTIARTLEISHIAYGTLFSL